MSLRRHIEAHTPRPVAMVAGALCMAAVAGPIPVTGSKTLTRDGKEEIRQAHNLEIVGSNPTRATNRFPFIKQEENHVGRGFTAARAIPGNFPTTRPDQQRQ